jgi:hypothetical protein
VPITLLAAISGHQRPSAESAEFSGHQRRSAAHRWSSVVIGGKRRKTPVSGGKRRKTSDVVYAAPLGWTLNGRTKYNLIKQR